MARTTEQLLSDARHALACSLREASRSKEAVREAQWSLGQAQRRLARSAQRVQAARDRIKELKEEVS